MFSITVTTDGSTVTVTGPTRQETLALVNEFEMKQTDKDRLKLWLTCINAQYEEHAYDTGKSTYIHVMFERPLYIFNLEGKYLETVRKG